MEIVFEYSPLPPSLNKLYFRKGRRVILTSEGRSWKRKFISERGGCSVKDLLDFSSEQGPWDTYKMTLNFFITEDRLYNSGYGKDKRVKSPFKKMDLTNLVKLIEDSMAELLGICDRSTFDAKLTKRVSDRDHSYVIATIQKMDWIHGQRNERKSS